MVVIPFVAVMNMNGTAIYEAVAVVVAKSEGELHPELADESEAA